MPDITISGTASLSLQAIGSPATGAIIGTAGVEDDLYSSSIAASGAPSLAYPTGGGIAIPTTGQIWPLGLTAR